MSARISLIAAQKSSCSARPKTCAHSRKLRRYRVRSCVAKRPSQPHSFASCAQESIVCDRTVVLAIHRAIHTRPLPTSVSLPGGDALVAKVKSYDGGSVTPRVLRNPCSPAPRSRGLRGEVRAPLRPSAQPTWRGETWRGETRRGRGRRWWPGRGAEVGGYGNPRQP